MIAPPWLSLAELPLPKLCVVHLFRLLRLFDCLINCVGFWFGYMRLGSNVAILISFSLLELLGDWLTFLLLNSPLEVILQCTQFDLLIINFFKHFIINNTKKRSKENISKHYELGNVFFSLWLDKTSTYASAIFDKHKTDLESAQINKNKKVSFLAKP